MDICNRCEKVRPTVHGSGFCRVCYVREHACEVLCTGCNKIAKLQGNGLCRKCYLAQPEMRARKNAARNKAYAEDTAKRRRIQEQRAFSAAKPDCIKQRKAYERQRNYGLTPEMFAAILFDQKQACPICARPLSEAAPRKADRPHVDHCHATGAVRGILCGGCNTGVGQLGDTPASLRKALAYLEEFEAVDTKRPPVTL